MTDTIKLETTLVQLDALYKAYDSLLESAKEQLETLDVSEAQLDTIAVKIRQNNEFSSLVRNTVRDRLYDLLRSSEEEAENIAFRGIVKSLTDRVWADMVPMVQSQIDETVKEAIIKADVTGQVETKVAEAVANNTTIDTALTDQANLNVLRVILAPKS